MELPNKQMDNKTEIIEDPYQTATFFLATINVGMYIVTSIMSGSLTTGSEAGSLFGLSIDTLLQGMIWTPVTSIFAHGNLAHIGFNMIYLLIFGFKLEERGYNKNGIYLIYISTGIIAGIASLLLFFGSSTFTLGASGAVFGLLGANVGIEKKNNDPNYRRVLYLSIILFIFSGTAPGTNIFAHLIGLIAGYYIGKSDFLDNYNIELAKYQ